MAPVDPTATQYFDALPDGWQSFPTCIVRAELLAGLRERGVITADSLPKRLHRVLEADPKDSEWIPEVIHTTAMLAVRDARFGHGPAADTAFLSWMTQLNRDLFGSSRHAAALAFTTPEQCVGRLSDIWSTFRRGSSVVVESSESGAATCVLTHPRALFAPVCIESHRRAVAILLVKAGAVQPNVGLRTEEDGDMARTILSITWT